jgi:hypothetical protein
MAGGYTGNLSDGGEPLRVVDGASALIALFTYDDADPWPVTPDGRGPALALKAPSLDPALPESWRASYSAGGSPGSQDLLTIADWRSQYFNPGDLADHAKESTVWGDLADPDLDGFSNLAEYALSGSPVAAASAPVLSAELFPFTPTDYRLRASFRQREGVTGVTITPQFSDNLLAWSSDTTIISGPVSQGDGTAVTTVQTTTPGPRRFFRVLVVKP